MDIHIPGLQCAMVSYYQQVVGHPRPSYNSHECLVLQACLLWSREQFLLAAVSLACDDLSTGASPWRTSPWDDPWRIKPQQFMRQRPRQQSRQLHQWARLLSKQPRSQEKGSPCGMQLAFGTCWRGPSQTGRACQQTWWPRSGSSCHEMPCRQPEGCAGSGSR